MSVEHHDLHHEFPEFNDEIHHLKVNSAHFRRLFDEYHKLSRIVENMENEVTPVTTEEEEKNKLKRLQLKDALYQMLVNKVPA